MNEYLALAKNDPVLFRIINDAYNHVLRNKTIKTNHILNELFQRILKYHFFIIDYEMSLENKRLW